MTVKLPFSLLRNWTPEKLSRHGAQLATLLLLAALAASLAQLTWSLWPQETQTAPPPVLAWEPAAGQPTAGQGLNQVAALHLFGSAEQPAVAPAAPVDAPDTRLNLELRGVMATESSALARAIIATRGGDELIYKVGDALPGGASLHAIHADRVILRRNGRFETLRLPKESTDGLAAAVPVAAGRRAGAPPAQQSLGESVRLYRQKLQSNPQALASLARIQPVMTEGRLTGYRLSPNEERQLFNRLGLRSGDIVTEVNGISVADSARIGELFSELSTAQRLSVVLQRRGRPTTISINLGE